MNKLSKNNRGYTLVELMIALFITGIISMAGMQFYVNIHNQALTQGDISDLQNVARESLDEISRTLRMAGYKTGTHTPYTLIGDTLFVYFSDTKAVDTVAYYLVATSDVIGSSGIATHELIKRVNSNQGDVFSDQLKSVRYTVISPSVIDVVIEATTVRSDENYVDNDGIRTFTVTERVQIRNMKF